MNIQFYFIILVCFNVARPAFDINQNIGVNVDYLTDNTSSNKIKNIFLQKGVRKSLFQLDSILKCDTNNVEAFINLGKAYFELGIFYESIRFFKKAMAMNDTSFETNIFMARAYTGLNKFKEATEFYEKYLTRKPENIEALEFIAEMAVKNKEDGKAEKLYKKILDKQPEHQSALTNLGVIFENKNKLKPALKLFETCVEYHPKSINCLLNLSYMNFKMNKFHESFLNTDKALRLVPEHPRANMFMGILFFQKRVFSEAIPFFEKYLKVSKGNDEIKVAVALCYYFTKHTDEALNKLSEVSNNVEEDKYEILLLMADICMMENKVKQAVEYIKSAIELDIEKPLAHAILRKVYQSQGMDSLAKIEEENIKENNFPDYRVGAVINYFSEE